mmetsp:Transcript_19228/g.43791  ORF Transcript_19228/g.43791 Transcript_19228/m.43791 type:complete len:210 (-) Transcript_19228:1045-1674(-)
MRTMMSDQHLAMRVAASSSQVSEMASRTMLRISSVSSAVFSTNPSGETTVSVTFSKKESVRQEVSTMRSHATAAASSGLSLHRYTDTAPLPRVVWCWPLVPFSFSEVSRGAPNSTFPCSPSETKATIRPKSCRVPLMNRCDRGRRKTSASHIRCMISYSSMKTGSSKPDSRMASSLSWVPVKQAAVHPSCRTREMATLRREQDSPNRSW